MSAGGLPESPLKTPAILQEKEGEGAEATSGTRLINCVWRNHFGRSADDLLLPSSRKYLITIQAGLNISKDFLMKKNVSKRDKLVNSKNLLLSINEKESGFLAK